MEEDHIWKHAPASPSQGTRQNQDKRYKTRPEEYTVADDILKKWMENARKQASDYLAQTIDDFKGIVNAGASTFVKEIIPRILSGIVILILITVFIKACS